LTLQLLITFTVITSNTMYDLYQNEASLSFDTQGPLRHYSSHTRGNHLTRRSLLTRDFLEPKSGRALLSKANANLAATQRLHRALHKRKSPPVTEDRKGRGRKISFVIVSGATWNIHPHEQDLINKKRCHDTVSGVIGDECPGSGGGCIQRLCATESTGPNFSQV
jgi:hypothetical protein